MTQQTTRRDFLKTAALVSGAFVVPQFSVGRPGEAANSRLNIAFIGVGGRGSGHVNYFARNDCNIVALCDVDDRRAAGVYKNYPDVPRFKDFRKMLDKWHKDIDAVVISTPDHCHFAATYACMERGIHVMTEKPLCHNVWEARTLKKAAHHFKVITQMGNQGHATPGIRLVKEWYEAGLVGQVTEVVAAFGGPKFGPGKYFTKPAQYPPAAQPVPEGLDWDLWLGPTKGNTAYNEVYVPKSWRGFYNFGNGELGDWTCHTLDAPFWALDLGSPSVVEPILRTESGKDFVPDQSIIRFSFPARGLKKPATLTWYEGGAKPDVQSNWHVDTWPGGMMMIGDKGAIKTGTRPNDPRLYSEALWQEFLKNPSKRPAQSIPRIKGGHQQEWADAIKGDGPLPGSNFDYASGLTELTLLGVLAQRFNTRIEWDSKNMAITNKPELSQYLREPARGGWKYGDEVWKS